MRAHMVIGAIAALVVSSWGFAQGVPNPRPGASTPVQVVNGPSNPVPVTGTIGLTGNANVTVTNAPSNPLPNYIDDQSDEQQRYKHSQGNPAVNRKHHDKGERCKDHKSDQIIEAHQEH